ncbi:hypothetical protein HDV00_001348 [Rhizophlyctis rosea]|nr:hypothetical protein HDV00_001348 [Rhizophlyctis rosea]
MPESEFVKEFAPNVEKNLRSFVDAALEARNEELIYWVGEAVKSKFGDIVVYDQPPGASALAVAKVVFDWAEVAAKARWFSGCKFIFDFAIVLISDDAACYYGGGLVMSLFTAAVGAKAYGLTKYLVGKLANKFMFDKWWYLEAAVGQLDGESLDVFISITTACTFRRWGPNQTFDKFREMLGAARSGSLLELLLAYAVVVGRDELAKCIVTRLELNAQRGLYNEKDARLH